MKSPKYLIIFCLLVSACSINQTSIYFTKLRPLDNKETKILRQDSLSLNLSFEGLNKNRLAMGVELINQSDKAISIVPALFYYKALTIVKSDSIIADRNYYSLDYQKERDSLLVLKDSLSQAKNPYSKKYQSTCKLMKTGLKNGAVELIFGLSSGSIEENRQEDEGNWYENHAANLTRIESQLVFWRDLALKETILAPKDTILGSLIFPIDTTLKQLVFELPINSRIYSFPFKQTFHK